MSARVLIVDDLPPNVKLLEAKLSSEYFDVITAFDGEAALAAATTQSPDIVLLDIMMPGMDGYEVCKRLKSDPKTVHIPIVMVTALSEIGDRVRGLEAGADDFLTKPVNDLALIARVKSLVRLKMAMDEWRLREETCDQFGMLPIDASFLDLDARNAKVLVVDRSEVVNVKIRDVLSVDSGDIVLVNTMDEALAAAEDDFDLVIVGEIAAGKSGDSLRLCSKLRSRGNTRRTPILILIEETDMALLAKALDLGVSDYLVKPIEQSELLARSRTQIRRRRFQILLRENYERSLSLALTDSLTGLYNRRYANAHLGTTLQRSREDGRPFALLMIDIDHFKKVNDNHGHAVGDEVLKQFAERIIHCVRSFDMVARIGGEEFIVVLPDTPPQVATEVAERLRGAMADHPFRIPGTTVGDLAVTVSVGAAIARPGKDSADVLLKEADDALYRAKQQGRNQVVTAFESDESPPGSAYLG